MTEVRAAVLLKGRDPSIGLTHCFQSIAFKGLIVFPSSDFEPTPFYPLQGNSASLSFATGAPVSNIQIIPEAVKSRLNAPDPFTGEITPPVIVDAAVRIGVDASVLSFIYSAVLSKDISWGPGCDRVEFYIQASYEQIRQASVAEKVSEIAIERWWLWKSDSEW